MLYGLRKFFYMGFYVVIFFRRGVYVASNIKTPAKNREKCIKIKKNHFFSNS